MWALDFYLSVTKLSETCLKWNSKISPEVEKKVKAPALTEAVLEQIFYNTLLTKHEQNSRSLQSKVNIVPFFVVK